MHILIRYILVSDIILFEKGIILIDETCIFMYFGNEAGAFCIIHIINTPVYKMIDCNDIASGLFKFLMIIIYFVWR